MTFDLDWKTVTSFLISVLLVVVQAVQGVYAGGITGLEWLGIALVVFGPAGLVAASNNTPWSPATKALVQHVSAVAVVVVQGVIGVYANGISNEEWLGIGLLLLSTLAVYVVPAKTLTAIGSQAGYGALSAIGAVVALVGLVVLLLGLFTSAGFSWVIGLILLIVGAVLWAFGGRA